MAKNPLNDSNWHSKIIQNRRCQMPGSMISGTLPFSLVILDLAILNNLSDWSIRTTGRSEYFDGFIQHSVFQHNQFF